jgi:hypothetical protein
MRALGGVPTHQTFKPAGLGISVVLPADWGTTSPDPGTRFEVEAPGFAAFFYVQTARTALPLSAVAANFEAFERQRVTTFKVKETASISSSATTVASSPAVLVTTRLLGTIRTDEFDYLVEHGGVLYIFAYSTSPNWLSKEKPIFEASIRSLRFILIA